MTRMPPTKEAGMDRKVMNEARQFIRNRNSTAMTISAPSSSDDVEIVDRRLDEVRLAEHLRVHLDARGQSLLDVRQRLFDLVRRGERVGAIGLGDGADDGVLGGRRRRRRA